MKSYWICGGCGLWAHESCLQGLPRTEGFNKRQKVGCPICRTRGRSPQGTILPYLEYVGQGGSIGPGVRDEQEPTWYLIRLLPWDNVETRWSTLTREGREEDLMETQTHGTETLGEQLDREGHTVGTAPLSLQEFYELTMRAHGTRTRAIVRGEEVRHLSLLGLSKFRILSNYTDQDDELAELAGLIAWAMGDEEVREKALRCLFGIDRQEIRVEVINVMQGLERRLRTIAWWEQFLRELYKQGGYHVGYDVPEGIYRNGRPHTVMIPISRRGGCRTPRRETKVAGPRVLLKALILFWRREMDIPPCLRGDAVDRGEDTANLVYRVRKEGTPHPILIPASLRQGHTQRTGVFTEPGQQYILIARDLIAPEREHIHNPLPTFRYMEIGQDHLEWDDWVGHRPGTGNLAKQHPFKFCMAHLGALFLAFVGALLREAERRRQRWAFPDRVTQPAERGPWRTPYWLACTPGEARGNTQGLGNFGQASVQAHGGNILLRSMCNSWTRYGVEQFAPPTWAWSQKHLRGQQGNFCPPDLGHILDTAYDRHKNQRSGQRRNTWNARFTAAKEEYDLRCRVWEGRGEGEEDAGPEVEVQFTNKRIQLFDLRTWQDMALKTMEDDLDRWESFLPRNIQTAQAFFEHRNAYDHLGSRPTFEHQPQNLHEWEGLGVEGEGEMGEDLHRVGSTDPATTELVPARLLALFGFEDEQI